MGRRAGADRLARVIDIKLVRDEPDRVRASQQARGEDPGIVDAILAADERRRSSLGEFESLRAEQKTVSKSVGAAMGAFQKAKKAGTPDADALEKAAHHARSKAATLSEQVKALESTADEAGAELDVLLRRVGNVIIDGVPVGGEDDYVVLETVGAPRDFAAEGFEPLDHLALGEKLGAIDMERGAKVGGARFYYLTGVGALLELALLNMAMAQATAAGFTAMITPTLARPEVMVGAGFMDAHAEEVYRLEADDLYLTGTSEVALAGYHSDEIIDLSARPEAVCRVVGLLPPRGRVARQGHPRHHPRAPVPQGRDVQLLPSRGRRGRAPAPARMGARDARQDRGALPHHRHRGR